MHDPQKQSNRGSAAVEQETPAAAVSGWLNLRSPKTPGRRPPWRLRKVQPDPLRSLEDFERFSGRDVAALTRQERAHEVRRLLAAAATVEFDEVPAWLWSRVELLRERRP